MTGQFSSDRESRSEFRRIAAQLWQQEPAAPRRVIFALTLARASWSNPVLYSRVVRSRPERKA